MGQMKVALTGDPWRRRRRADRPPIAAFPPRTSWLHARKLPVSGRKTDRL